MWNVKNPAVRRIRADIRELAKEPSDQYAAKPLDENMFEWHFAIRGPKGTDYEGGVYHGRITLPSDYPFKPPSIMFLTPNGRWETKQKICLSISSYHPEQWQPAWGVRTILEALISFMAAPGDGAVGAIECSPEVRKKLARDSMKYKHPLMPKLPELGNSGDVSEETKSRYAEQVKHLHMHSMQPAVKKNANGSTPKDNISKSDIDEKSNTKDSAQTIPVEEEVTPRESLSGSMSRDRESTETAPRTQGRRSDAIDSMLHHLSIGLMMAIFVILYRKALQLFA